MGNFFVFLFCLSLVFGALGAAGKRRRRRDAVGFQVGIPGAGPGAGIFSPFHFALWSGCSACGRRPGGSCGLDRGKAWGGNGMAGLGRGDRGVPFRRSFSHLSFFRPAFGAPLSPVRVPPLICQQGQTLFRGFGLILRGRDGGRSGDRDCQGEELPAGQTPRPKWDRGTIPWGPEGDSAEGDAQERGDSA